ncbi:7TM-DISM domain-containing protein, partial [Pedobacter sp.]
MRNNFYRIFFFLFASTLLLTSGCKTEDANKSFPFKVEYFKDKTNNLTVNEIINQPFEEYKNTGLFNFGIENVTIWLKLISTKEKTSNRDVIYIEQPRFQVHEMFDQKLIKTSLLKTSYKSYQNDQSIAFYLPDTIKKNEVLYLKLKANEAFITRISVIKESELDKKSSFKDIIFGIYTGVMLVMF